MPPSTTAERRFAVCVGVNTSGDFFGPSFRGTPQSPQDYVAKGTRPGERGTRPGERGTRPGERGTRPGDRGTRPGERGTRPGERGTRPGERRGEAAPESVRRSHDVVALLRPARPPTPAPHDAASPPTTL